MGLDGLEEAGPDLIGRGSVDGEHAVSVTRCGGPDEFPSLCAPGFAHHDTVRSGAQRGPNQIVHGDGRGALAHRRRAGEGVHHVARVIRGITAPGIEHDFTGVLNDEEAQGTPWIHVQHVLQQQPGQKGLARTRGTGHHHGCAVVEHGQQVIGRFRRQHPLTVRQVLHLEGRLAHRRKPVGGDQRQGLLGHGARVPGEADGDHITVRRCGGHDEVDAQAHPLSRFLVHGYGDLDLRVRDRLLRRGRTFVFRIQQHPKGIAKPRRCGAIIHPSLPGSEHIHVTVVHGQIFYLGILGQHEQRPQAGHLANEAREEVSRQTHPFRQGLLGKGPKDFPGQGFQFPRLYPSRGGDLRLATQGLFDHAPIPLLYHLLPGFLHGEMRGLVEHIKAHHLLQGRRNRFLSVDGGSSPMRAAASGTVGTKLAANPTSAST